MDDAELQKEWEKLLEERLNAMLDIFQGDRIVQVELPPQKQLQ